MIFARQTERSGSRAGCNNEVLEFQLLIIYHEPIRRGKTAAAVICLDTESVESCFHAAGHGVGESFLERHQGGPVDARFAACAKTIHAALPVDESRGFYENLLGVTAAQAARSAVWLVVHDRNSPAVFGASIRDAAAAGAGTDDNQIVDHCHLPPS